ncbi:Asp-tRNA(Asn)/Glu-tRNA(Gln) amidotransferase subunit GatB [Olsenella uli]|uniref:Asp-tRNA(Asn)/Glu-tRNA(Gln) amidotransferase subunit GatB n=1 Tax=Olsenella uli TaxID=133926 RepID=UPI00044A9970|nr:Asp-tRNA(Asn)/Glu-tRNA(Gln) amidotransferase subunit GatB [Olsenella uli]EUB30600.1 aspartyl/glutamyl-tRNA(Asn/Gln) amidotransferase, B subunit [Olsenella uli MSTE5]
MRGLQEVLRDWEAVIGLEVHTELTTLETKMFCNCRLSHDDEPNANVCPVCLGMPGALPVPNREAIRSIVMAGLATNCEIKRHSMFYRKHYFYPDMAKNFQTTQGPVAFCMHGRLDLEVGAAGARERPDLADATATGGGILRRADGSYVVPIRILRIHMEEDAAKMVHVGGEEGRITAATESLIDYNRCGAPLIELVTEPDLRTPEEARLFMEKLQQTFRTLGISDCSLESGSMRCDGNISLRRRGEAGFGTKTEMKNINSFKSLHDALEYEICRQAEVLEEGGIVYQETRHWEPSRRRTVVMRVKETADDYRLFPDPDLAPFDLTDEFIEACRSRIPELPDAKRDRYVGELGLKRDNATQIAGDPVVAALFEEAAMAAGGKVAKGITEAKVISTVANVVVNLLPAFQSLTASQVASIASLLAQDAITFAQAREVLAAVDGTSADPGRVVDERGMRQTMDASSLEPIVDEVLGRCVDQVQQYRDGNKKVVGFLVGQCMKASKTAGAKGNPKLFNQLLAARLEA